MQMPHPFAYQGEKSLAACSTVQMLRPVTSYGLRDAGKAWQSPNGLRNSRQDLLRTADRQGLVKAAVGGTTATVVVHDHAEQKLQVGLLILHQRTTSWSLFVPGFLCFFTPFGSITVSSPALNAPSSNMAPRDVFRRRVFHRQVAHVGDSAAVLGRMGQAEQFLAVPLTRARGHGARPSATRPRKRVVELDRAATIAALKF